jgi:hypothetical protein
MVGRAQSCGAGSHNGNPLLFSLWGCLLGRFLSLLGMFMDPIGHEALQGTDCYGTIQLSSITLIFAGVITDATNRRREGVILLHHFQGFRIAPLGDEGDIPLGTGLGWTSILARARSKLGYQVRVGNGLRIGSKDGLSVVQSLVELVAEAYGANRFAIRASGTFFHIHIPGMTPYSRLEVPS